MKGLGNMVGGWNEARKCLGSLRTQNQGWEMVGFAQSCLEKFPCKMMKLVRVLMNARNDHGWMKFEGVCLL